MTTRLLPAATRGTVLLVGLTGYGFSMAMMVRAGLGLDPWDVFHQGLARHTGMTIGIASAVVGVAVLLAWIPLRNRPGIGTIANVIVIAVTVDAGLWILPTPTSLPVRTAMMVGAVLLNAFSTVLYVGAGLGPGPRDGLMTGLVVRTGLSVRLVRTSIEATVLAHRLAAGRHRRRRHRRLRVRHRPAGPALPSDHAAPGAGPQRLGVRRRRQRFGRAKHGLSASERAEIARATRKTSRASRYGTMVPCHGDDAADPDLLIDFAKVSLRRGGQVLVGPVTWSVELDERWVVVGPNGAGKTSLLRIAAAMEHPSSGTAYVLGERLGRVDMSELRARVGLSSSALSQRVPDGEVVRDLVVSAGYAVMGRWRERYDDVDYAQAVDMLESVGAEHLAERTYETLSEGERKRVLIARSLMTDPELLLLDEPAAGLDLGGREELVARLADLAADPDAPAMVLVTHHVEEIPQGFSHCLILSEGRVVDCRAAAATC